MKIQYHFILISLLLLLFVPVAMFGNDQDPESTGNAWKQEYAEVCGKTQNAMTLSTTELQEAIDRCDRLGERLGELGEAEGSERKVYTKRLKMCRELYIFTLDYREKKE